MPLNSLLNIIFQVGLVLSIAFTALQFIRRDDWWIRVSDFPHIQTTVLTFLFLLGSIFTFAWDGLLDWFIAGFGLLTLIYQAIIIYPYTRLSTKQAKNWSTNKSGQHFSILEANVYMFNKEYSKLLNEVHKYDPDVLIALETDEKWNQALAGLNENYPHTIEYPKDNTYGILLFSKLEITEYKINFWINDEIPSVECLIKLRNEKLVKLYVVHPEPPSPSESHTSTERDAELIVVGKKAAQADHPVIVAGDLNDVAWSHTTRLFQRLSGLLDPRIGRGFFNTFHAKYRLLRWPLDHVFHSDHFLVGRIERGADIGSDHFPMFIELILAPQVGKNINGATEELTEEDELETRKKLEKALE
ncbi:MAG: endonuclease/exonuclease/phosphatase family protein [Bacteroidota bacterium]